MRTPGVLAVGVTVVCALSAGSTDKRLETFRRNALPVERTFTTVRVELTLHSPHAECVTDIGERLDTFDGRVVPAHSGRDSVANGLLAV